MSKLLTISELKAMLDGYMAELPEVNYTNTVIDDSQLANIVKKISEDENMLLVGVVPDYTSETNEDEEAFMLRNSTEVLVLKKTDYSRYNHEDFMAMMDETLAVAEKLIEFLVRDKYSGTGCAKLPFLNEQSIQATPVWRKSECNGWMVSFNLRTT